LIPWIQVYSNLIKHPKTTNLADELSLSSKDASPNAVASGMLVSLWLWAAQNATDGDLSACSDRAIAEAAEYRKKPTAFVQALIKTKWLDEDRRLHNWDEYATLLIDVDQRQREQTKARVQKHRERKKSKKLDDSESSNVTCNVTETQSNAPTIHNHTVPYNTLPDQKENGLCGGGGDAGAGAATEEELSQIGLRPGEYFGVTSGTVRTVIEVTRQLMITYAKRTWLPADCRNVFLRTAINGPGQGLDRDSVGLLEYAAEQAAMAGKAGQWHYINGILDRLAARGIQTPAEALAFDRNREEEE
jgi:hypothetical protein